MPRQSAQSLRIDRWTDIHTRYRTYNLSRGVRWEIVERTDDRVEGRIKWRGLWKFDKIFQKLHKERIQTTSLNWSLYSWEYVKKTFEFCLCFFAECNAGYYGSANDTCTKCSGNEIKSAQGDAPDCSADSPCDGVSDDPNVEYTACGKLQDQVTSVNFHRIMVSEVNYYHIYIASCGYNDQMLSKWHLCSVHILWT